MMTSSATKVAQIETEHLLPDIEQREQTHQLRVAKTCNALFFAAAHPLIYQLVQ